jgi:hypothetical protein
VSVHDTSAKPSRYQKWLGIAVHVVALVILASIIVALLVFVIGQWNNQEIRGIVVKNLQASVGLPVAGVFAFLVVALFRTTEGQIKFEALGLKFEGAAGPIIMWVFCFLAITISIRLLWG